MEFIAEIKSRIGNGVLSNSSYIELESKDKGDALFEAVRKASENWYAEQIDIWEVTKYREHANTYYLEKVLEIYPESMVVSKPEENNKSFLELSGDNIQ